MRPNHGTPEQHQQSVATARREPTRDMATVPSTTSEHETRNKGHHTKPRRVTAMSLEFSVVSAWSQVGGGTKAPRHHRYQTIAV